VPTVPPAVRVTLADGRLLAVAAVAAVVETALRLRLAAVHPVGAVLAPPVVALVVLGTRAPAVRAARRGAAGAEPRTGRGRLVRHGRLVAVAVAGHAVALALGVGTVLVVDTAARAVVYGLGAGDRLSPAVALLVPLPGVAVATWCWWTVPALAAVAVVDGASTREAVRRTLVALAERPRGLARGLGLHLGTAALLVPGALVGVAWATRLRAPTLGVGVGGSLTALVSAFALALLAARHLGRRTPPAPGPARSGLPLARLAVAGLAVTGVVVGAGAVRSTELRPLDAAPEPLPDDPDAAYATARANTERASHAYRVAVRDAADGGGAARSGSGGGEVNGGGAARSGSGGGELNGGGEPFVVERRVDRADRRFRSWTAGEARGPSVYAAAGTGSPPMRRYDRFALGRRTVAGGRTVRATPGYVLWADAYDWEGGLSPPAAVDGWRVADRRADALVLVVTAPRAVLAATSGLRDPDRVVRANESRVRAVVDPDRGTLRSVESRLDVTVVVDGERHRLSGVTTHEFAVDVDVERPAALGAPSPGERLWKLFVY
jgi:hypothetical protein